MGTKMAPLYVNLFTGKEERTIILAFFHLIYFWKRFIDDNFLFYLVLTPNLNLWWRLWTKVALRLIANSPTPNKLFLSYMCKSTFLNLENTRQNFTEKPLTAWRYFTSIPTCVSIQYDHLQYNMIISSTTWSSPIQHDHIHYLVIKNIKKALIYNRSNFQYQRTQQKFFKQNTSYRILHTETKILPIIPLFSGIGKTFITTIQKNWHVIVHGATLSAVWPFKPSSAYSKSSSIHSNLVHSTQTYG